ncbi:peptidase C15 [uncultured Roseibium sp.]|uniref:pyroglutamyl-peptidase I family protein n=1 Tax=uncultured Roseibium sp. TaxID=1936171 RepID=UPI0026060B8B|nr:peptidase C15 [uncultured Roseibium sp.]
MRRANKKILVTGFSPFPGSPVNPTEMLMHRLPKRLGESHRGVSFVFAVLPTTWAGREKVTDRLRKTIKPDAIIHFGVDGTRRTINVETRAVNQAVRVRPDAVGDAPKQPELQINGERSRSSTLPARALLEAASSSGAPVRLSSNAGTYLCNATLWDSIGSGIPSIFVHVPTLPKGKMDTRPSLPRVEDAAVRILQETARRLQSS